MKIEVLYRNEERVFFDDTASFKKINGCPDIFYQIREIFLPNCVLSQYEYGIFSMISNNKKVDSSDIGYCNAGSIEINDWGCCDEGNGYTKPVLLDLLNLSGHICAQTIESRSALTYWLHMCEKGLIQQIDDVSVSTGDPVRDKCVIKYLKNSVKKEPALANGIRRSADGGGFDL